MQHRFSKKTLSAACGALLLAAGHQAMLATPQAKAAIARLSAALSPDSSDPLATMAPSPRGVAPAPSAPLARAADDQGMRFPASPPAPAPASSAPSPVLSAPAPASPTARAKPLVAASPDSQSNAPAASVAAPGDSLPAPVASPGSRARAPMIPGAIPGSRAHGPVAGDRAGDRAGVAGGAQGALRDRARAAAPAVPLALPRAMDGEGSYFPTGAAPMMTFVPLDEVRLAIKDYGPQHDIMEPGHEHDGLRAGGNYSERDGKVSFAGTLNDLALNGDLPADALRNTPQCRDVANRRAKWLDSPMQMRATDSRGAVAWTETFTSRGCLDGDRYYGHLRGRAPSVRGTGDTAAPLIFISSYEWPLRRGA